MKKLLIVPLFLLLGACASTVKEYPVETRVVDTSCDWVPEGSFSRKDTKETKQWMLEYEKARRANCPKKE
jgi:hypothetical protein